MAHRRDVQKIAHLLLDKEVITRQVDLFTQIFPIFSCLIDREDMITVLGKRPFASDDMDLSMATGKPS